MLKRMLLLAGVMFSIVSQADSLVRNGDFSKNLEGWSKTSWTKSPGEISTDDTVYNSAPVSIRINNKNKGDYTLFEQNLKLETNKKYRLSFWMKGENIAAEEKKGAEVFILDKGKFVIEGSPVGRWKAATGTFDWTKTELEFTLDKINGPLILYAGLAHASGIVWFDDFSLEEIGKKPASELMTGSPFPVDYQKGFYHLNADFPGIISFKFQGIPSKLRNPELILEVPEGISCLGACPWLPNSKSASGGKASWEMEKMQSVPVERDNSKYTKYTISISPSIIRSLQPDNVAWNNEERVYIKTLSAGAGERKTVYWYLKTDDWKSEEKKINVEVLPNLNTISSSKTSRFGMLLCYFWSLSVPDGKIREAYTNYWKSLSDNRFALPIFNWHLLNSEIQKNICDNFKIIHFLGARKDTPLLNVDKWCENRREQDKNFQVPLALNADGKTSPGSICPSFLKEDNEFWDYTCNDMKNRIAGSYKPVGIVWDIEPGGMDYCFCENCLDAFRKYAKLDKPVIKEDIKKKYSKEWFNFRVGLNAGLINRFCAAVKKNFPDIPPNICTDPLHADGEMIQQWCCVDVRLSDGNTALFMNMPYYSGVRYFNDVELNNKLLKTPNFPLNDPAEQMEMFFYRYTPEKIKQNIVATAALACKGFGFWPGDALDGAYLQNIKEAYSLVAQAENYYFAERKDKLMKVKVENVFEKTINENGEKSVLSYPDFSATIKALLHREKDSYLVTIFNYDENEDMIVRVSLPEIGDFPYTVRELNRDLVYTNAEGKNISSSDIRKGFLAEVKKSDVAAFEIKKSSDEKIRHEKSLSQTEISSKLEAFKNSSASADKFSSVSKDGAEAGWGILKPEKIPMLKLSQAGRTAYIDVQKGAIVSGWLNSSVNFSDLLYHKSRGFLGNLIFYDDIQNNGFYPFILEKLSVENASPCAQFFYRVPSAQNADPEARTNEGLEVRKKICLKNNGNRLKISFTFTNQSPAKKNINLGFRIKNYPRLGSAFAGGEALSEISKITYQSPAGSGVIASGASSNNLFLKEDCRNLNFLKGQIKPAKWIYSDICVKAGTGNRALTMKFSPQETGTAGFYTWWSLSDLTVELLSTEKTLNYGQSYTYEYLIDLQQ